MGDWIYDWLKANASFTISALSGGVIHVLFTNPPPREAIRKFFLCVSTAWAFGPLSIDITEHYTWLDTAGAKSAVVTITGLCSMQIIETLLKRSGGIGSILNRLMKGSNP